MTEPLVCGHATPNGPCTRKVLPGAGGCGYHPGDRQADHRTGDLQDLALRNLSRARIGGRAGRESTRPKKERGGPSPGGPNGSKSHSHRPRRAAPPWRRFPMSGPLKRERLGVLEPYSRSQASRIGSRKKTHRIGAMMIRITSSTGPGIGKRARPAIHRRGLGIRLSRARTFIARIVRAANARTRSMPAG